MNKCTWTQNMYGVWRTECGHTYMSEGQVPLIMDIIFCGFCGKPIEHIEYVGRVLREEENTTGTPIIKPRESSTGGSK